MQVDMFTLCDSAQVYEGKIVAVGTFNQLNFEALPNKYPSFSVALRVSLSKEDAKPGEYELEIYLKRPNGKLLIAPIKHVMEIGKIEDSMLLSVNLCGSLNLLEFYEEGAYTLGLKFLGKEETRFFVVRLNRAAREE